MNEVKEIWKPSQRSSQRSIQHLKRFASDRRPKEACELCSGQVAVRHQHLIDPSNRKLICACDGCATLFDADGATKFRRVPRRIRRLKEFHISARDWESLGLPINLVFFYRSSFAGKVVALYPSPGGVMESLLPLEHWNKLIQASSELSAMKEDVEALLVSRLHARSHARSSEGCECFISPIDRCFELVGRIRSHWEGFSGGDRVWEEVNGFLSVLQEESKA